MGTQLPLPKGGGSPQFSAHLYCAQTAGCIKMPLCTEVGLDPSDTVRWGPSTPPKKGALSRGGAEPPIFGPCLLWPNVWHGGRPRPCPHCVRWAPSSPSPKGAQPLPIFGQRLLCPNGWIYQDATWYGGKPRPKRDCVIRGPISPSTKRGAQPSPQFLAHVYCGQTVVWIKIKLGM